MLNLCKDRLNFESAKWKLIASVDLNNQNNLTGRQNLLSSPSSTILTKIKLNVQGKTYMWKYENLLINLWIIRNIMCLIRRSTNNFKLPHKK